ncbi:uncharacterized protein LOC131671122 [Phymastichus coffea]|uniref:uncharacterized protein LOC131671122 n=1 Tax=Phymastichus coffea TaxID=108790 RepID=UPI00273AF015|nr:uncharacterized protein LOC131671122 [Phymastichus coffea]
MPQETVGTSNNSFSDLITKEEAINLVKVIVSPNAELIDYKIRPYSDEKLGFSGSHQKLILESNKPGDSKNEVRSFFVKAMPYDISIQADYASENGTFLKETEFFRELVPLMIKNYKGEAWGPKCYLVKGKHCLVFEDLGPEGFSNSKDKFLDENCVMSAVACIARLHASSLLAEELLNGKSLRELYPNIFEESEYRRTGRNYEWFVACIDYLIVLAEEMGLDSSCLAKACDRVFDVSIPSKTKRNVLSHGDLWSNNIIFDKANRCRLVDFQLMRYAPIAHDLMVLLYFCTPREFRESKEAQVIHHYYKIFQETLNLCDYKGQVPSFEELKQGVEEQRLPALIIAAANFHMILMDGKEVAEIMNDPKESEIYFFKERKRFVDKVMAQNLVYAKRVKDITREMVEMSLKFDEFPKLT